MKSAIVAFSFGFRKDGPGESNIALSRAVDRLHARTGFPVVAQHEIAACLKAKPAFVIQKHRHGAYLDTDEVADQAAEFLRRHKIRRVLVVAQPFLHVLKCSKLMRRKGFDVAVPGIGKIPFDTRRTNYRLKSVVIPFVLRYDKLQETTDFSPWFI